MGGAVACGLISTGTLAPSEITLASPHLEKVAYLAEQGVRTLTDNVEAVKGAELVILAVKPWILPDVAGEISGAINPHAQEVCAIVAGVSGAELQGWFAGAIPERLSIAMPNTAMSVAESMTFIVPVCGKSPLADRVFSALGLMRHLPEGKLAGAMSLASCGTAFAMRYVRAAGEAGVQMGFRAYEAQAMVAQTLKGAAILLEQAGAHPEVEIDKVTTPGGITIRGLNAMEAAGFTNAVIRGHLAAANK